MVRALVRADPCRGRIFIKRASLRFNNNLLRWVAVLWRWWTVCLLHGQVTIFTRVKKMNSSGKLGSNPPTSGQNPGAATDQDVLKEFGSFLFAATSIIRLQKTLWTGIHSNYGGRHFSWHIPELLEMLLPGLLQTFSFFWYLDTSFFPALNTETKRFWLLLPVDRKE